MIKVGDERRRNIGMGAQAGEMGWQIGCGGLKGLGDALQSQILVYTVDLICITRYNQNMKMTNFQALI